MDVLPNIEELPSPRQLRNGNKFRELIRDSLQKGKFQFAEFQDEDSRTRNIEVHEILTDPFEKSGETVVGAQMVMYWANEDGTPRWQKEEYPEYSEDWVEEVSYFAPVVPLKKPTPAAKNPDVKTMLHVVLDIDDTLLKHAKLDIWEQVADKSGLKTYPASKKSLFILRPHLDEFMNYLFDNCVVSLWTWSDQDQVTVVAKMLTELQPGKAKFKDLLSEEDGDLSTTLHGVRGKDLNQLWQDYNQAFVDKFSKMSGDSENVKRAKAAVAHLAKRNATIDDINEEREAEDQMRWDPKPKKFFTDQAPCNTILVDDANYNQLVPSTRKNMIHIKAFGGATETAHTKGSIPVPDKNDVGLLKTIEILKAIDQSCKDKDGPLYPQGGPKAGKRRTLRIKKKAGTRRYRKRV